MRIVLYTNCISPHQLPLAGEIVRRVGAENYRYVYTEALTGERARLGWSGDAPEWCIGAECDEAREWLENAEVMISGLRDIGLMERRAQKGLKNFYMSERWFKPPVGILRMLHPRYFRMARRMRRMLLSGAVTYLPMGIWAARDMARLVGLLGGEVSCLWRIPRLEFGREPMGKVEGCGWQRMWGYFVAPSEGGGNFSRQAAPDAKCALRILWVGRLLALKRVDTLFKAAAACLEKFSLRLTVVGDGPERGRLEALGAKLFAGREDALDFRRPVPIGEVRELMRGHDVYVLPSNGYEGWGAVVSEALEEGMEVLGTYEAGSSATMLDSGRLFHAGDWRRLAELLDGVAMSRGARGRRNGDVTIGEWSAKNAAEALLARITEEEDKT